MGVKTRRIFVRVTEEQHEHMMAKARSYGIPLSALVLMAVEAYARTFCGDLADEQAVAVNYGVWLRVDRELADIGSVLREAGYQLVGVRRAITSCLNGGVMSAEEYERAFAILRSVRTDVKDAGEGVTRCVGILDRIGDAVQLVDPYLGPMGQSDEGEADGTEAPDADSEGR